MPIVSQLLFGDDAEMVFVGMSAWLHMRARLAATRARRRMIEFVLDYSTRCQMLL